jgi:hypothetical protein
MKEVEAINLLEKKYKSGPQYSQKEAVELAISTLQVRVAVQAVQAVRPGWLTGGLSVYGQCAAYTRQLTSRAPLPLSPCLQHVLGEDLKASDIEVGLASGQEGGRFRVLSSQELEEHLIAISERD